MTEYLLMESGDALLMETADHLLLDSPVGVPFMLWPRVARGPQRFYEGCDVQVGLHVVVNFKEQIPVVPGTAVVAGPQKKSRFGGMMLNSAVFFPQPIQISEEQTLLFGSDSAVVDGNLASGRWRR